MASGNNSFSYTGDGVSGIYVWGAQLEQRSTVTAYTPTTDQPITRYQPQLMTAAVNTPRIDFDPVTGECKGLLIEEQRTNLLTYSSDFSSSNWLKNASVVIANAIIAPDGTLTGCKLNETATNNYFSVKQAFTLTAGSYTRSVYAKAGERTWMWISVWDGQREYMAWFDLVNGAIGTQTNCTASILPVGNGWYRCAVTVTIPTQVRGDTHAGTSKGDNIRAYTGTANNGIYIWGAQLEAGAFPTSYIPTTSSQVTRSADSAVMTGTNFTSWFNEGAGSLYAEFRGGRNSSTDYYSAVVAYGDGLTLLGTQPAQVGAWNGRSAVVAGVQDTTLNWTKAATAYDTSSRSVVANGSAAVTGSGSLGPISGVRLGAIYSNPKNFLNGHFRRITYWPTRLPNAQLQALTA